MFRDDPVTSVVRILACTAAVFYIGAVVVYLAAGLWPSPTVDRESQNIVDEIWEYCAAESKPIKLCVTLATSLAVVAIFATGATLIFGAIAEKDPSRPARVSLIDTNLREHIGRICPAFDDTTEVLIVSSDDDRIVFRPIHGACPDEVSISVESSSIAILFSEDS